MNPSWKPLKYSRIVSASSGVSRIRVLFIRRELWQASPKPMSEEPGENAPWPLIGEHGMRTEAFDLCPWTVAAPGEAVSWSRPPQVDYLKVQHFSTSACQLFALGEMLAKKQPLCIPLSQALWWR